MFVQSLTPFFDSIQPSWENLKLSQHTLFKQIDKHTLESNLLDSITYQRADAVIPIDVQVSSRTRSLATIIGGTTSNIDYGVARTQTVKGYLDGASDVVDTMEALRLQATDPSYGTADREKLNADFQTLLTKFDDFYQNGAYGTSRVLQGGTYDVTVGLNGQSMTVSNGNLDRQHLGLVNLDISTASGAAAAETVLSAAKSDITGQSLGAQTSIAVLDAFKTANTSYESVATRAGTTPLSADSVYSQLMQAIEAINRNLNASIPSQAQNLDSVVVSALITTPAEQPQRKAPSETVKPQEAAAPPPPAAPPTQTAPKSPAVAVLASSSSAATGTGAATPSASSATAA